MEPHHKKPGDYLLDKYLPNANEETRERARDAFRDFAFLLLRIGDRLYALQEQPEDSPDGGIGAILFGARDEPPL